MHFALSTLPESGVLFALLHRGAMPGGLRTRVRVREVQLGHIGISARRLRLLHREVHRHEAVVLLQHLRAALLPRGADESGSGLQKAREAHRVSLLLLFLWGWKCARRPKKGRRAAVGLPTGRGTVPWDIDGVDSGYRCSARNRLPYLIVHMPRRTKSTFS